MASGYGSGGADGPGGRALAVLVVVITGVRVGGLALGAVPLFGDEAQYWAWSRTLAWGYYSKPPMVAWLIALSTSVLGDGALAIRLASPLLHAVTSVALARVGIMLFDRATGFWAGLLYLLMPAVSVSATVMSTDPALLTFWSLALAAFVGALRARGCWAWAGVGALVGLGLLAKYTAIAFLPSMLLYLAASRRSRPLLASTGPYLAIAVALAIAAPNLLWNARHGFVSLLHVADVARLGGELLHPGHMLEFVGAQLAVFGPLPFVVLLALVARMRERAADDRMLLLVSFTMPLIAVMTLQALLSRAYANWAAASYAAASVAVAAWLGQRRRPLLVATALVHGLAAIVIPLAEPLRQGSGIALPYRLDPYARMRGWPEAGDAVAQLLAARPGALLLGNNRLALAEMVYYGRVAVGDVYAWPPSPSRPRNHFELVNRLDEAADRRFLFIGFGTTKEDLEACFLVVEPLPPVTVRTHPDRELRLSAFALAGLHGCGLGVPAVRGP